MAGTSDRTSGVRLLTAAVVVAALGPRLAAPGMFLDGVTYAAVARNLAEGRGTFWTPFYTRTLYPAFHEHPPLAFWLQSLWFRLMGDHAWVERLYCAAAAIVTVLLIESLWRRTASSAPGRESPRGADLAWLPVLVWIAVPVVSWALVGNLLEGTLTVFTTAAVLGVVIGTDAGAALSGVAVVAAVLTKGPVGLFPLAAPVVAAVLSTTRGAQGGRRDAARHARLIAIQWGVVLAAGALLLLAAPARASLRAYLDVQLFPALAGRREIGGDRFAILETLAQGVLLPMAGVALVVRWAAGRWDRSPSRARRAAAFFCGVALCGILPLLVSPKQAGHYLVPAVPCAALACALWLSATAAAAVARLAPYRRRVVAVACALIAGSIAVAIVVRASATALPWLGRDRARVAAVDAVGARVPRGGVIAICPDLQSDWGLHAWFERRDDIALEARADRLDPGASFSYLTTVERRDCVPPPPARCAPLGDPSGSLLLMRCGR